MKRPVVLVLVLAACSAEVDVTAEQRVRCQDGIARANEPMKGSAVEATMLELCIEDDWPATVIACFATTGHLSTCKDRLSPEQRGNYARRMMRHTSNRSP